MSLNDDLAFEIVQPRYHEDCGHYHYRSADCPERNRPCGSYLCCGNPQKTELPDHTRGC